MTRRIVACALLTLLSTGCIALPTQSPEPTPVAQELPPDKAAEVSLLAARDLEKLGNEADAIAQYEKASQLNPKLTQVSRRLAVLYDRQGDFSRAVAEYRLALQQSPKDADLLNDLGYCHYQHGDWAEAEKWLRQAVTLQPDNRRAWGNLGLVLGRQERYQESYAAFARVVSPAEARANIGILQAQQGQKDQARTSLREALSMSPDMRLAQEVLARVEGRPSDAEARLLKPKEQLAATAQVQCNSRPQSNP